MGIASPYFIPGFVVPILLPSMDASGPKLPRLHSLVVRQRLDNLAKDDGASRPQKPRGGFFLPLVPLFFFGDDDMMLYDVVDIV